MLESDRWWPDLCKHIDRPDLIDDPRFVDAGSRTKNSAACVAELDTVFASRTLEEWRAAFETLAGAWGPVQSVAELHDDVQAHANGYLPEVTHQSGTTYRLVAAPAQFDQFQPELQPCPEHGQDTEEVLLELGLEWDRIAELKDTAVIT
jgi:crotonobetainyl-CoA:carnitine CoA-transferase CaiB-like acyl-CoA transferase